LSIRFALWVLTVCSLMVNSSAMKLARR